MCVCCVQFCLTLLPTENDDDDDDAVAAVSLLASLLSHFHPRHPFTTLPVTALLAHVCHVNEFYNMVTAFQQAQIQIL